MSLRGVRKGTLVHADADSGGGLVGAVRRRPLTAFLVWFFTVGQLLVFIPVVAGERGLHLPFQLLVLASTLVGLLLPAVVITRIVDGPAGLRTFIRRSFAVRVSLRWYVLALVAVPLVATALAYAFLGAPTANLTVSALVSAWLFGQLVQTVVALAPVNWAEEVAWTGFFQARLQERTGSAMRAAALTAPLFALQHVALAVGNPPLLAVAMMLFLALIAIPFRAVIGWAYNTTGSFFVAGLIHAAGNSTAGNSGFASGFLPRLYPGEDLVLVMHLVAFAVIGMVVMAATRGRLGLAARGGPDRDPDLAS